MVMVNTFSIGRSCSFTYLFEFAIEVVHTGLLLLNLEMAGTDLCLILRHEFVNLVLFFDVLTKCRLQFTRMCFCIQQIHLHASNLILSFADFRLHLVNGTEYVV